MTMKRVTIALAAILALGLGLAACETVTPYQPLAAGNKVSGGFTDKRLDDNHFQVLFRGNSVTSRDQVETYLLYRAAELTANNGFDWFEMVQRHTENRGGYWVQPWGPYGYYWGPSWRFYGSWGWGPWGDWGGYDVQRVDEYEALAEVATHHGPKPADNPRALDAHQVLANLEPRIVRPH